MEFPFTASMLQITEPYKLHRKELQTNRQRSDFDERVPATLIIDSCRRRRVGKGIVERRLTPIKSSVSRYHLPERPGTVSTAS